MIPTLCRSWLAALLLSVAAIAMGAITSCKSGYGSGPTSPGISRELDSGDFGPGDSYAHRFAVAGAYGYHCNHHAVMTGAVQVSESAADTLVNVSIISFTSPFPAAAVKPGGRVVWTNNSGMVHTVTSD